MKAANTRKESPRTSRTRRRNDRTQQGNHGAPERRRHVPPWKPARKPTGGKRKSPNNFNEDVHARLGRSVYRRSRRSPSYCRWRSCSRCSSRFKRPLSIHAYCYGSAGARQSDPASHQPHPGRFRGPRIGALWATPRKSPASRAARRRRWIACSPSGRAAAHSGDSRRSDSDGRAGSDRGHRLESSASTVGGRSSRCRRC